MTDLERLEKDVEALKAAWQAQGIESAIIKSRLDAVYEDVQMMMASADARYVTLARYSPVEKVVYGGVGAALLALLGAVLALVIR